MTKRRALPFSAPHVGTLDEITYNHFNSSTTYATWSQVWDWTNWQGSQVTDSENHPSWKGHQRSFQGDIGGPFFTEAKYIKGKVPLVIITGGEHEPYRYDIWHKYQGPMISMSPSLQLFPPSGSSSDQHLFALGTTAIARCKPTNSVADVSVALAELKREGLPHLLGSSLWKSNTKKLRRKPGDEYLNVEFGWKPLAADFQKFLSGVTRADAILRQYERDAGRVVRRRFQFPPIDETEVTTVRTNCSPYIGPSSSLLYDDNLINKGRVVRTRRTVRRQWFSGGFTYHLPTGYDSRNAMDRVALKAKKVYGLTLSPDVVWNLTPWSWAADWFANTGDVISNLTDWSSDGLVLKYGYIMEHCSVTDTYTFEGPTGLHSDARPSPLSFVTETKRRLRASPFGFGLTWDGFSPRQLAIAAALGLTKS